MLLKSSETFIAMDADISSNTINHIKLTRGGDLTYIENTYKEVQSEFEEFYTSKLDTMFDAISVALTAGEKIVIPTNRSTSFMEALKCEIIEKFPNKVVQLFNSKTIRVPEIARQVKNTDSWKENDVVIYSPTISAGVSVEYEYFNSCFCYFVNNGKVNSMRQMINRVRKFSTNRFYFCLQSFGGSHKPTSVVQMERYITSNRFVDTPNCIFTAEKYDGTKTYPYKNLGYHLWIHNEIELARDKTLFVFNFLREQYHCGVGKMSIMERGDPLDVGLSVDGVKDKKKILDKEAMVDIAEAGVIDEAVFDAIKAKLEKDTPVSESEILSMKKFSLLKCYELDTTREIDYDFVKTYSKKPVKSAFHARNKIMDLRNTVCNDGNTFNGLYLDNTSVVDDLKRKYMGMKLVVTKEMLSVCGFDSWQDTKSIDKDILENLIERHAPRLHSKMTKICDVFGRAKSRRQSIKKMNFRSRLDFINGLIFETLHIKIKQTSRRSGRYEISGLNLFDF